ncbi:MAG: LytR family transcriptional regulator [Lachnospiraceae bacterium]|nr:LytR family transcriptional regulator [Lachnospiraceae bacterium]
MTKCNPKNIPEADDILENDDEIEVISDDPEEKSEEETDTVRSVKKKRKKWPIVLACVLGGIIIVIAGLLVALNIVTGGFRSKELNKDDLGIVETTTAATNKDNTKKITKITNIAFFGIDTRDFLPEIGDQYRSDSIIIMSINPMNNTIKMTSILRDSKVPMQGYEPCKINSAYQKGGPALAINTLNTNFQLDIEDYVTVDFGELATAIDIVGGVDIELAYNEAEMVNFYSMDEMHYYDSFAYPGWNHLCGAQAVSYARIRNLDTDVFRASRQQTVLTALFDRIKATPKSEYPALITQLLGCVETSLTYADIISIVSSIDVSSAELIKNTVPDLNYQPSVWGGYDESIDAWVWIYDLDYAAYRVHTIIYGTEGNGEGETEVETVDPNTSDVTY